MKTTRTTKCMLIMGLALALAAPVTVARGDDGHSHGPADQQQMIEQMRQMHADHDHGHDFEAMENATPEEMRRIVALMADIGLALPPMDSHRGRHLFLNLGCVACHSINGVGGDVGPSLNAADMPRPMNAFEFAARMWRSAPAMAQMQDDIFGQTIEFDGQDLADLIAFAHDEAEQGALKADQIPERYRDVIVR